MVCLIRSLVSEPKRITFYYPQTNGSVKFSFKPLRKSRSPTPHWNMLKHEVKNYLKLIKI